MKIFDKECGKLKLIELRKKFKYFLQRTNFQFLENPKKYFFIFLNYLGSALLLSYLFYHTINKFLKLTLVQNFFCTLIFMIFFEHYYKFIKIDYEK
jgi:hypothetical protein